MNTKLAILVAFIIVMGFVACYATLMLTPTSDKDPGKGELRIVSSTDSIESVKNVTFFAVKGIVQNNYTTNMRDVNITVIFYDAENRIVGDAGGCAAFKIVKPEQKTPFEIYVQYAMVREVYNYSLTAVGAKTDEEPFDKLQIVNQSSAIKERYHQIVGEVLNEERWTAVVVKVICTYYDSEGNLTDISHVFASPNSIPAGGKASFEINLKLGEIMKPPDRFELFVVAHHYEVIFIGNYVALFILMLTFLVFVVYMKRRGW